MALYTIANENTGGRGLWSDGVLTVVDAGSSVVADLTDADKAAADATGYFTITKATKADAAAASSAPAAPAAAS